MTQSIQNTQHSSSILQRASSIALLSALLAGCAATGGGPGNTLASPEQGKTTAPIEAARPWCNYHLSSGFGIVPRFYQETKRETGVGQPIKEGSVLFYGQYSEVQKLAVAQDMIENRDRSPITPNWAWAPGSEEKVVAMINANDNWWYLIESHNKGNLLAGTKGYGFWVSNLEGMLCGNVLSPDGSKYGLTTAMGLSNVYQNKPIRFVDQIKTGVAPISVSVSVVKVIGATATIEVNVMKDGRALRTERTSVDLIGGEFSAAHIRFITERANGTTTLKSVSVPEQITPWLGRELQMK